MQRNRLVAALTLALWLPTAALAAPKDDARRYFLAGLESAQAGDYEAALEQFLLAQAYLPHPATLQNIARAYTDLGQYDKAIEAYEQIIEEYPDRADSVRPQLQKLRDAQRQQLIGPAAPAVVETTGDGEQVTTAAVAAATGEELERLRAVAEELESLAELLSTRGSQAQAQGEGVALSSDDLGGGDFLTDAYERVVVSASRQGQSPLDSPSTITVITAEDIKLSGATQIADVLRSVPGVDVMSLANGSSQVAIRGFNSEVSNKVLWLIDGRTVYWDFLSAVIPSNITISMDEIERIEVIRGPGSAVYGANAMTGVINIITRAPGDGPKAQFRANVGYPAILEVNGLTSGRTKNLSYRFSAGYEQEGRWAAEAEQLPSGVTPFFENQNLAYNKLRANGRIDYNFLDEGYASLSGGYARGNNEFYNLGALGDYGLSTEAWYLRGDATYGPIHLRTFWNHEFTETGPWVQPVGTIRDLDGAVKNDTVDVELEGNFEFETGPIKHRLNVGGGYRYKLVNFDYLSGGYDRPWVENHFKAFLQEQATWEWLSATFSFRVDVHPLVPVSQTLSPRGALNFRVTDTTSLRVSAGTAFRGMSFTESYSDFQISSPANGAYVQDYGWFVNPNNIEVVPERLLNVEIGAHDESSLYHTADVAVFYNRVTSLIVLDNLTPTLEPFNPIDNGFQAGTTGFINEPNTHYDAVGAELDANIFPVDGLDINTNVSFERIFRNEDGETTLDESTSLVKFNVGAMYRSPFRMDFTVNGTFYSKQVWSLREFDANGQIVGVPSEIPARFIASARIAGRPLPSESLELAVVLWNPIGFGTGFQEHPKGQPVGPRVFGSVSLTF